MKKDNYICKRIFYYGYIKFGIQNNLDFRKASFLDIQGEH